MLDENFKVYLIEVNTNPCLEESSGILKMLLPRMIEDMFKLTVDMVFPKNSIRKRRDGARKVTKSPQKNSAANKEQMSAYQAHITQEYNEINLVDGSDLNKLVKNEAAN